MSRLRIYFDVSVLGDAWYNQLSRTGIARVADRLFVHLARRADVELIAFSSSGNERAALRWLEARQSDEDFSYCRLEFGVISYVQGYLFRVESWMREKQRMARLTPLVGTWRTLKNLLKSFKRSLLSLHHSRVVREFRSEARRSVLFDIIQYFESRSFDYKKCHVDFSQSSLDIISKNSAADVRWIEGEFNIDLKKHGYYL